jgi:hypothetical protein
MMSQACKHCGEAQEDHLDGMTITRDCLDTQIATFLDDPTVWPFLIGPEQVDVVLRAYDAIDPREGPPEIQAVMNFVAPVLRSVDNPHPFWKTAETFWRDFANDIPEWLRPYDRQHPDFRLFIWPHFKTAAVLRKANRKFLQFVEETIEADLNDPETAVAAIHKVIDTLTDPIWKLFDVQVQGKIATWTLRRAEVAQ